MEAYRWLGEMANEHLVDGGILLVQCGTQDLLDVGNILTEAGLSYQWIYNITYADMIPTTSCKGCFIEGWKPVLIFSKGIMRSKPPFSDTFTVRQSDGTVKTHHPWQQPLKPWIHFLKNLSAPGALIADPFAGSGTNGVAVKSLGEGRRYVGTEIDSDHCRVARQRLADA